MMAFFQNENNKNPYFKSGTMDKIRYESTQAVKDSSKYSVMVVQDNEVHITPVKG